MAAVTDTAPEGALSTRLSILNESPSRIPGPSFLHELVSLNASDNASPALDFMAADGARSRTSYQELHKASTILSQRITESFPGTLDDEEQFVVPILLPQCPELYVAQLAILKAGGAFCPLNLDAPLERVKFIIGDVSAKIMITNSELASKVPKETGITIILVDEHHNQKRGNEAKTMHGFRKTKPQDLAYVMYTSGSTGTPKGVGISHDAATQSLLAHDRHIPRFRRFLQFAAPTFDVSVFEIFFPFFRGGTLVSCDRSEMLNDLPEVLRKMQVDACELTPTVAGSLLRSRANAPGLRLLLTIGEMLTEPVIKEFGGDSEKSSILWAMYGPTEATIHCTLQTAFLSSSNTGNIGIPLDTVSSFVLKPLQDNETTTEFEVLPLGEIGELAVGGHQLATGYINRAEQTTAAFIQTPYGRLYRTGDKARILPEGRIECLGRISEGQVKLRGQRIELGEIEQAALRTPGCRGAVTAVLQGILVLFCEVDDEAGMGETILETCQAWLPSFMVPNDVMLMRDFPRLASGKIDRKQMKTDYSKSHAEAETEGVDHVADEAEQKMIELAKEALGVALDRNSSLAASGMDSITAIRFASLLRHSGFEVSAVDVLSSKTISRLRNALHQKRGNTKAQDKTVSINENVKRKEISLEDVVAAVPTLRAHTDAIQAILPCTPVQESMLAETSATSGAYCNWIELEFPKTCKSDDVMSWIQILAESNEALRTGFAFINSHFTQVIWKKLDESQIRRVKRLDNKFEMGNQKDLLRPFDVQVSVNPRGKIRMLLRLHHAIYDGWSFDLILSDLNSLAQGQKLLERPQFSVVSQYYRSSVYAQDSNTARTFWAEHLQGFQPKAMPQLLAKSTNDMVFSASRTVEISPAELETLSRRLDCSIPVFFQACLIWLWGGILGNDDVVIGTVTSGRTIAIQDIENVVGPCLNTVPLRTKISQARTIRELLESIHATNRESLAHCTLPLMEIKRAAGVPPGKSLYDALFVFQESIHSRNRTKSIVRQVSHQDYLETKLLMEVEPLQSVYECRITYHLNVFHYAHVQILLGQLQSLVKYFVTNLDAEIASIPSCFTGNLVSQYNTKPKSLDGVADLAASVESVVSTSPEKPALCFARSISEESIDAETISYRELNTLSNRVAWYLQANDAKEGSVVSIIMEKSILLYAGILGILKAGCAYLPLLPTTPPARIKTILRQADVDLCVTDSNTQSSLHNEIPARILNLQDAGLQKYSDSDLNIPPNPNRNANIIYTSGSTGVPKGVCVTQLNITSNLDVLSRIYPVREGSRLLQSCSQAFDVSVFEIFFTWSRGMCLCSATNDTLFEDLELSIRMLEVTHLSMTPTVASLVTPANVPKVEFLITSGEPMTEEVARKWTGQLYQGYGPSETTNICSVKKMVPGDMIRHLGYAFENTSAFVLAQDGMDIMPVGCVGELCFGGEQVAAGYLKLPELTSQKFINHPQFGRLYRSGDMGRMLADGSLLIIGRVDDQVKLRGQRIELGEINSVISSSENIRGCVTLLDADNPRGPQLVSFYVPRSRTDKAFHVMPLQGRLSRINSALYGHLKSKVPMYMIPSHLVPVSTIPTTSSGKVDKDKLRSAFKDLEQKYLESSTAPLEQDQSDLDWSIDERNIAKIVVKSLDMSEHSIGRWTPFTSLGLDSISAIPLAKKLQQSLRRRVPVSAILQNPCIASLARVTTVQDPVSEPNSKIGEIFSSSFTQAVRKGFEGKGVAVQKILPCTPLQEAMLASSTVDSTYVNRTLLRVRNNPEKLKDAWMEMCQRHDILRTCFVSTEDAHHPVAQVILESWEPPWHLMNVGDQSVDRLIDRHVKTISRALDSNTPPVSFAIIKDSAELFLSFICHHALYDGVAVSQLFFEIEQLVHGASLPPPPSFELVLQQMLSLPESTEEFWQSNLSGLEIMPFPRVSGLSPGAGKETLSKRLDLSTLKLNARLRELNVSLLSIAEACWGALLTILVGCEDVCFGNVVSGRSVGVERVDELVAPCFNTIPIRLNISEARRNIDVMRKLQKLNPELLQYQFTPLRRIQNIFSKDGSRLFDTLLLLQQPPRALDDTIWSLEKDDGVMDFTLVCELTPLLVEDNIEVTLHYDRSSIDDDFALLIYDTLAHTFADFLRFPSSRLPSLKSLPDALKRRFGSLDLEQRQLPLAGSPADGPEHETSSREENIVRSVLSTLSNTSEKRIHRQTTIYQLGLDSINAVQIAAMLRKQGLQTTATEVIEHPTCGKLAAHLTKKQPQEKPAQLYDLKDFQAAAGETLRSDHPELDNIDAFLPCTPLQAGLIMEFLNSKGENYFNFITLEMNKGISLPALREAWLQVVNSNAMLRTGFIPVDHRDTSFAMLQYNSNMESRQLLIVPNDQQRTFDHENWQCDARHSVLRNLQQPPWRVALTEAQNSTTMHLAIHHALYDAQSLHDIFQDLTRLLRNSPKVDRPKPQDAVQDIMTQLQARKEQKRSFWEVQSGRAVINNFPLMTPLRRDKNNIRTESLGCDLSQTALQDHVKASGFTVQAAIQAAWSRILSSYLGEPSVMFGVVLSGRNSEATRDSPLPCVTTLPVIAESSSDNKSLLDSMMQFNTKLHEHQHTPLTAIQRWLGHPNTRLFDSIIVYQRLDGKSEGPSPWKIIEDRATVDYPLSIEVEPHDNEVQLRITFNDNILPTEQAKLLLRQFNAALCDLAQNPEGKEEDLLESHPELFSVTPAEYCKLPSDVRFLHEFVEATTSRYPDKEALQFISAFDGDRPIGRNWTYRDLNTNGNKVANTLAPYVQPGGIVAIYFDKCPEAHFAILGILKAGCSFVALDSTAPPSRKEFIVRDSGASVLVTDVQRSKNLDFGISVPVVGLDEDTIASASSKCFKLSRPLNPNDRSYCLYTSGTTGTPKGCEITHENAVQAMLAFQKLFEKHYDPDSKWLQFASYHFDVSVLEQFWTWSVGIKLVAAPRDVILEDLTGIISRLGITHIDLTPSLARLLHPDDVPSLCRGVFITGGETLKQEILDVWGDKGAIHNFYGPTEATIGVTTFPRVPRNGRASNIGRQFANVGSYVLRPGTDIPVLRGGVGELCVSGPLVGKGYLNREDLTAERFPTLEKFNERVYRTGDLVRVLCDGCFDFLGRADDQVKLRGQRLEIGEINHCIKSGVPEVTDVATVVVRNEKQHKDLLVSFIVTTSSQGKNKGRSPIIERAILSVLGRRVQDACRSKLPGYMVPTYILELPFIPLSPNNKAETKELKRLFNDLSSEQLIQPSNGAAANLGAIGNKIGKVLGTMEALDEGEISTSTNIFEVGIDSISVLRFVRGLKREGLAKATPALVMKNPTIGDLVEALDGTQDYAPSTTLDSQQLLEACQHRHRGFVCKEFCIKPEDIEYLAPCSALQQGMISRSRNDDNKGAYFNTFRFHLEQGLEPSRLRAAWQRLVDENAILRTRFVGTSEGYIQVAMKEVQLPWIEISPEKGGSVESLLGHLQQKWVESNSQVIEIPLEILFLEIGGERTVVLHIFHGIYDANSFEMMLEGVTNFYKEESRETTAPRFLDALLSGPLRNYSFSRAFWESHLKGALPYSLPTLADTPCDTDLSISRTVSFKMYEKLRRSLGVTHQTLIQALWTSILPNHTASGVTIGVIISGRSIELENADRTIGPLFNTVPYHHQCHESESWASAIRKCHDFNTELLQFQHVPLRDIQKWCSGGKPLFDTLFSFQNQVSQHNVKSNLWTRVDSDVNPDYPLAFEVTLLPDDNLQLVLVAQKGVADKGSLNGLLDSFEAAAKAAADAPDGYISPSSQARQLPNGQAIDSKGQNLEAARSSKPTQSSDFVWTARARTLQDEIAVLANVETNTIDETTGLLELGLDSIDTIKLSAKLKHRGIHLTNSQLIRGQCIQSFVKILGDSKTNRSPSANSSKLAELSSSLRAYIRDSNVEKENVEDVLPPTPLQDSMISEMIQSDFHRYFNHDVLELPPDVDFDLLRKAWSEVIANSPILRTVFMQIDSPKYDFGYCQLVLKNSRCLMQDIELGDPADLQNIMDEARKWALQGAGGSNLLQLAFVNCGAKKFLVLSIAHALYDGWSLALLHQDVRAAYTGSYSPRGQNKEYMNHIIQSTTTEASAFWSDYLSGAEPTHIIPSHDTDAAAAVYRAEAKSSASATAVKDFCKRHGISVQTIAQASWAAMLASRCKALDVTFGVVLSGRETESAEELMFPTMNTVPIRSVLHGTVSSLLRYMQENMSGVNEFQHFPLRKIRIPGANTSAGLFNTLFILQKSLSAPSSDTAGLPMRSVGGSSAIEYPVCGEMEIVDDSIVWRTACESSYLTEAETDQLIQQLDAALVFFMNMPDANVLVSGQDGVSICGLPRFQLRNPEPQNNTRDAHDGGGKDNGVWSQTENTLRSVLADLSGVDTSSIRKDSSIYHLGLDSISAIKASSLLRKKGVAIGVRDLLKATSISEMAEMAAKVHTESQPIISDVEKQVDTNLQVLDIPALLQSASLDEKMVEAVLPATAMQGHMLTVWQNTNGAVFFPTFTYKLSGVRDHRYIEEAWRKMLASEPILRTCFISTERRHDIPFAQVVLREFMNPHNLVSLDIVDEGNEQWTLSLRIHHALYDGVSLPNIMDRFRRLLKGSKARMSESSTALLQRWKSFVSRAGDEGTRAERKRFWRAYLQGATTTQFEISRQTKGHNKIAGSDRVEFVQKKALPSVAGLREISSKLGLSIQSLFLAAYAEVLATHFSSEQKRNEVVFGIYLANRGIDEDVSQLPYPTLCLVPLRVKLQSKLHETAQQVQSDLHRISSAEAASVGLWEIQDWTGVVLDSFVNFLSLPKDDRLHPQEGDVQLQEVAIPNNQHKKQKQELEPRRMPWLSKNPVRDAYPASPPSTSPSSTSQSKHANKKQDAVDVEVAVTSDGAMDIGVFGSEAKLGIDGCQRVISEIVDALGRA